MNKLKKLLSFYERGNKISCITAYDASMSKYLDSMGIDIILVGDSLGQVIKGEKSIVIEQAKNKLVAQRGILKWLNT